MENILNDLLNTLCIFMKFMDEYLSKATLIPMNHFKKVYGENNGDFIINLKINKSILMIEDNTFITYKKINETCEDIVKYIKAIKKMM